MDRVTRGRFASFCSAADEAAEEVDDASEETLLFELGGSRYRVVKNPAPKQASSEDDFSNQTYCWGDSNRFGDDKTHTP
jgi:hypothetical protein